MRYNFYLLLASLFCFIFVPIFYISSNGIIGEIFAIIIMLFLILSFINSVAKSKSKVEHVSVTKFFPVIIVPITLILSSGIIFSVFPYLDILSKSGSGAVAFYFIFVILSIMAFMGFETSSRIEGSLTPNGYEKIELEKELGFFQRDIAMLGFVSLFLSLGVIIILEISPSLNIGLIPAVIIFFVVYAIVLGTMLKKD